MSRKMNVIQMDSCFLLFRVIFPFCFRLFCLVRSIDLNLYRPYNFNCMVLKDFDINYMIPDITFFCCTFLFSYYIQYFAMKILPCVFFGSLVFVTLSFFLTEITRVIIWPVSTPFIETRTPTLLFLKVLTFFFRTFFLFSYMFLTPFWCFAHCIHITLMILLLYLFLSPL